VSSICGHQFPALPVDAMMMTMMMTMMMGEDKNGVLIPYASNGVLPLTLVACCICIPITQYKAVYVVTVGYGLSIATLGLLLLLLLARSDSCPAATAALSPSSLLPAAALLSGTTALYGLRLTAYLLVREARHWPPPDVRTSSATGSTNSGVGLVARLKRIPLAISLALLYGCMMTPAWYVVRASCALTTTTTNNDFGGGMTAAVSWTGVLLALFGAILEAVADFHKFRVKTDLTTPKPTTTSISSNKSSSNTAAAAAAVFQGPTSGAYKLTRHPNYTGEVLHWVGVCVAGIPSFFFLLLSSSSSTSSPSSLLVGGLCSTVGLLGIVSIMVMATKRLERQQAERYGGQASYEEWKRNVPAPLLPFLTAAPSSGDGGGAKKGE
jgi:steroid 5-alpha reductase family enzyme